jgi:DedD protein
MDPALKQRLIGAAVLVVLAVIFVPMLIESGGRTETQVVDLSIPAEPDQKLETRVVPLDPAAVPQPAQPAPAPADTVATVDAPVAPRADALEDEPVAPVATPASARPQQLPAPAATPRGRYVVSFGSYAKKDNAQALVEALRKAKIQAYAEDVDVNGQPGQRVRAGPFVDRTQADQVRLLARQARPEVTATIVEVDDTPAADAPATAARGAPAGWAVQVGAFQARNDADAQRDRLRGAGFAAFVDTVRAEKGTLYRVRVGPEAQRANAEKLRDAIKARFQLDGLIVAHP